MADDVQRDIGSLQARADAQEARLERIESKVDVLVDWMAEARGSWKTLAAVGTISAAIGAFFSRIFEFLWKL